MNFPQKQAAKLLNFFSKNGIDLINFAVLMPRGDGEEAMQGDRRLRDQAEVEKSLPWATAKNAQGRNVYFRPARYQPDGSVAAHPVVFLDDMAAEIAEKVAKKYRSLVVETSSANFQAWIIVDRPLSESERRQVQAVLAKLVGADPGSTSRTSQQGRCSAVSAPIRDAVMSMLGEPSQQQPASFECGEKVYLTSLLVTGKIILKLR